MPPSSSRQTVPSKTSLHKGCETLLLRKQESLLFSLAYQRNSWMVLWRCCGQGSHAATATKKWMAPVLKGALHTIAFFRTIKSCIQVSLATTFQKGSLVLAHSKSCLKLYIREGRAVTEQFPLCFIMTS